jgi:hypothetical protein
MRTALLSVQDGGEAAPSPPAAPAAASLDRWWVLLLYSLLSALQSLLWITFSSVPEASKAFLRTTDDTLSLFLDWGPLAFCLSAFPAQYLLSASRSGLQRSIRLGFGLCLLAAALRLLPAWLPPAQRAQPAALAAVHLAQFLNGAVAPLAVASPAYLSLLWFPESERNLATAVANTANALGRAVGFFLGPALVATAGDVPTLLYVTLACAAVPAVAAAAHLPLAPPQPPSAAAAAEAARWGADGRPAAAGAASPRALAAAALAACRHPAFLATALCGGVTMAWFGAWSGELTPALTAGGRFSDAQAGSIGALTTFAGIAGGVCAGGLTDLPALQRSLRGVVLALALASALLFLPLALALPPLSALLPSAASAALTFPALMALCGAAGFVRGGLDPLFFELAAETAAEVSVGADMAGSVLTLVYHVLLSATLSVPAAPLMATVLAGMPLALLAGAAGLVCVRVEYRRRGGAGKAEALRPAPGE